jgi:hypothetical protein
MIMASNNKHTGFFTKIAAVAGSFVGVGSALTGHADPKVDYGRPVYGAVCTNPDGTQHWSNRNETERNKLLTKHADTCVDARADMKEGQYSLKDIADLKKRIRQHNAALHNAR